ncbi:hypothetical protein GCM10009815_18300 [Nocardioides marmoribigeumensis]
MLVDHVRVGERQRAPAGDKPDDDGQGGVRDPLPVEIRHHEARAPGAAVTCASALHRPGRRRSRAMSPMSPRQGGRTGVASEVGEDVVIYLAVNAFLVVLWAGTTGADAFFWPVFPIAGWGIGVIAHWWDAYHGDDFTEEQIRHEMERLARSH